MHISKRRTKTATLCALAAVGLSGAALLLSSPAAANPIALNTPAPELVGGAWLNTPRNAPITLASRKGKVTIVEFWTFACSNCAANLPAYARWQQRFAAQGVVVIGVHTPELDFERDPKNIARAVKEKGITYPILLDANNTNWNRWNQQYWPTIYLVDKQGRVRYEWIGELGSGPTSGEVRLSNLINQLLIEGK